MKSRTPNIKIPDLQTYFKATEAFQYTTFSSRHILALKRTLTKEKHCVFRELSQRKLLEKPHFQPKALWKRNLLQSKNNQKINAALSYNLEENLHMIIYTDSQSPNAITRLCRFQQNWVNKQIPDHWSPDPDELFTHITNVEAKDS